MATHTVRRGRPKIHEDDAILEAALREFAVKGYEGTSLRSLNNELGLNHGTINIPFGSALTHVATLPAGAQRALSDPYADRPLPWGRWVVGAVLVAAALAWISWSR